MCSVNLHYSEAAAASYQVFSRVLCGVHQCIVTHSSYRMIHNTWYTGDHHLTWHMSHLTWAHVTWYMSHVMSHDKHDLKRWSIGRWKFHLPILKRFKSFSLKYKCKRVQPLSVWGAKNSIIERSRRLGTCGAASCQGGGQKATYQIPIPITKYQRNRGVPSLKSRNLANV